MGADFLSPGLTTVLYLQVPTGLDMPLADMLRKSSTVRYEYGTSNPLLMMLCRRADVAQGVSRIRGKIPSLDGSTIVLFVFV